jgi:hypothetical protein
MHFNLLCKVGRASWRCAGTRDSKAEAEALQVAETNRLMAEGNAPERIQFEIQQAGEKEPVSPKVGRQR